MAPGHTWSTFDAHTGLHAGFTAIGVESWPYALDMRLPGVRDLVREQTGKITIHEKPDDRKATEEEIETTREVIALSCQGSIVQALAVGAEAVVVVTGLLYDPRMYILLARAGIPVFVYGTESPYNDHYYSTMVNMVAAFSTNELSSLPTLQAVATERGADTRVMYMPLGYDPARHYPGVGDGAEFPAHDVVMVGNMYPSRQRVLEAVDWSGIDLALYGVFISMTKDTPLWQHVRGGATPETPFATIDNRATAALYAKSKIVLNLFRREEYGQEWTEIRECEGGSSINPRLIEAAACGRFILSEWRPEVQAVFGDLVPTFKTAEECERLVRYYLAHDEEREAMAAALPAIVAGYSYHTRAQQIADVMSLVRADMGKH